MEEILNQISNGVPGVYSFFYDGCEYKAVVGDIAPGNPVGITVHGGGAGGGYSDTLHEQRALLDGQTIDEALKSGTYNITGQNQIDIFPVSFEGYHNYPNGPTRITNLVSGIANTITDSLGNPIVYMPEGHSATCRSTIKNAMLYAERGGTAEQIIALSIDPAQNSSTTYTEEDVKFMLDHNITVLQVRGNTMCGDMQDAINKGMPFIDVKLTLLDGNGREPSDFWVKHRVPRTMLGDFDYSDIANGTFSWADVFGVDKNGNYPEYYDEYNNYTYRIKTTVVVYNVPGFNNGEEVPLEVLDNYFGSLVMSDEEYLELELSNMKSAILKAKALSSVTSYFPSYSTTIIPSSVPSSINSIIVYNDTVINRALEALEKIEAAKESYKLVDRDLYLRAIDSLNTLELLTPAVIHEDTTLEENPNTTSEIGNESPNSTRTNNPPNSNNYINPPVNNNTNNENKSNNTNDEKTSNTDSKTDTTKEENTNPEGVGNNNEKTPSENQNTNKQSKFVSDDSYIEKLNKDVDDKEITKPTNKVNKTIPSKAKTTAKKSTSKSTTSKTQSTKSVVFTPENEVVDNEPINSESDVNTDYGTDYFEDIPLDVPVEVTPEVTPEKVTPSNDADILKTIGITAGIGAGIGAVAYGVNEQIKKKDYEDGFDYSYSKGPEKSDYLEQESQTSEYSPYAEIPTDEIGPYNVDKVSAGGEE